MAKTPASTLLRRLKDVSLIQVSAEMSLQHVKLSVSLMYQLVHRYDVSNWSFLNWSQIGIYVPVRRRKNVPNRSVLLTYQLRCRVGVSAWSQTLILVTEIEQFYLGTTQYLFSRFQWFSLIKILASTSLQRLKDVGLIQVLVVTSLRLVKLVSLAQVSIGTSLRRLRLVGFIYVPMKRCKVVSFTYQLQRHDDV